MIKLNYLNTHDYSPLGPIALKAFRKMVNIKNPKFLPWCLFLFNPRSYFLKFVQRLVVLILVAFKKISIITLEMSQRFFEKKKHANASDAFRKIHDYSSSDHFINP